MCKPRKELPPVNLAAVTCDSWSGMTGELVPGSIIVCSMGSSTARGVKITGVCRSPPLPDGVGRRRLAALSGLPHSAARRQFFFGSYCTLPANCVESPPPVPPFCLTTDGNLCQCQHNPLDNTQKFSRDPLVNCYGRPSLFSSPGKPSFLGMLISPNPLITSTFILEAERRFLPPHDTENGTVFFWCDRLIQMPT